MGYKIKKIFIGTNQVRPSGWQPGANTLAYWKLDGTLTDEMGNYNLTNSGTTFYNDTSIGRQVLYCDGSSHYVYTTGLPSSTTTQITLNIWCKGINEPTNQRNIFDTRMTGSNRALRFEFGNDEIYIVVGGTGAGMTFSTPATSTDMNNRGLWTITYDWNTKEAQMYFNGVYKNGGYGSSAMDTSWLSNFVLGIGFQQTNSRSYNGYIGETILENIIWSAQDISYYFNKFKGNYGL